MIMFRAFHRIVRKLSRNGHINVHDYAVAMKLSGFSLDEAIAQVERLALKDNVKDIDLQTLEVFDVYSSPIKTKRCLLLLGKKHHTRQEWLAKQAEYQYRCAYCGCHPKTLTKDHVIAIARGGTDEINNIVPSCWACNHRKLDRPVEDFTANSANRLITKC